MKMKRLAFFAAVLAVVGVVALFCGRSSTTGVWSVAEGPAGAAAVATTGVTSARAPVVSAPAMTAEEYLSSLPTEQSFSARGTKPFVLSCETRFNKPLRQAAEALGVRTVGVRSPRELIVEADDAARARLAADKRFTATDELLPRRKVSQRLAEEIAAGAERVQVAFLTLSAEDRRSVKSRVTARGGEILKGCLDERDTFRAEVPAELVADLVACGDVRWMEKFVRPHFMNDMAVEPEAMNVRAVWKSEDLPEGLSGDGQIITTSDSGIDTGDMATLHEDLRDRVVGIKVADDSYDYDDNGHGTHTAGSIVGTGVKSDGQIRGTAWGAHLYAWFCGGKGDGVNIPPSVDDLFRPDQENYPAYIHSASWGSNTPGTYDAECRSYDEWAWEHADFLPVYSAGNEGNKGPYTVGSPAAAKNVLAVGATQNLRVNEEGRKGWWGTGDPTVTAEYSSRGPCKDGRIKPDIATPGSAIVSTRSTVAPDKNYGYGIYEEFDGMYAYDFGTSMACPLMAGNVALVREWLLRREEFSEEEGRRPTAALMKAIVTGGAKDAPTPNNDQGWGRADIAETLFPSGGRAVKLVDRIPFEHGVKFKYLIETTNAAPLDVQLAWVDYPGHAEEDSKPQLVNDLDLTVEQLTGGDGSILLGNGGKKPDRLNNVESVRLANAEPDLYLITVCCTNILYDYTKGGAAALYVRGAFDPDVEPELLPRARIGTREYYALDKALKDARSGDTVEILRPVNLRVPCAVAANCTLVATNDDPTASAVTCAPGAALTVDVNARVLFTNVAFAAGSPAVTVATNGVAALAGRVEIGEINAKTNTCVELAGALKNLVFVRCASAKDLGQTFGFFTCDPATAMASALKLVNAYELEYGGEATADGKLRWTSVPVDPTIAVAYHTGDGGDSRKYYAHLHKIFNETNRGDVVLLRDCTLEALATVRGQMQFFCTNETGAVAVTYAKGADALIAVESDGEFAVSNVVLTGASYRGAILVRGGELTLENGTVIENCANWYRENGVADIYAGAGGVTVTFDDNFKPGHATVSSGVVIRGCEAVYGGGGGIFVEGDYWFGGCSLDLRGGTVTNCSSANFGGGLCALSGAAVELSGDVRISSNVRNVSVSQKSRDNLYVGDGSVLTLAGELTAGEPIGLRCAASVISESYPPSPDQFGLIAADLVVGTSVTNSARLFRSDDLPAVWHGEVGTDEDGNAILVWSDATLPEDETDPEPESVVRVIYAAADGTVKTNTFRTLDRALKPLNALRFDGTVTVELMADRCDELVMSNGVQLAASVILKTSDNDSGKIVKIVRPADRGPTVSVNSGADLTLTNVWLSGGNAVALSVCGGVLTMEAGSTVSNVTGKAARNDCGVSVGEGGTFTMRAGAEIVDCVNSFASADGSQRAHAGGVIVEGSGSVFKLEGGAIHDCAGASGGGVFVSNDAKMFVSGAPRIVDNHLLSGSKVTTTNANLSVANESDNESAAEKAGNLILAGKFTGDIGVLEPRLYRTEEVVNVDTNVFGKVSKDAGDAVELVPCAARFHRDAAADVTGRIVTNANPEVEALLVWSSAVKDGVYTDAEGNQYLLAGEPPPPPTEIDPPSAVTGLIYNGNEQTGVVEADGYTVTDNKATAAGDYTATVTLKDGYVWTGGSSDPLQIGWSIAKATYDMSGVVFTNVTYVCDGTAKNNFVDETTLPSGVSVTNYLNNGQTEIGVYTVTAQFGGDETNYEPIDDMTATLTITKKEDPEPDPKWEVVTNHPGPLAFKSIDRVSDTEWTLVVTNRTPYCNYRLIWTTDLTKGFTSTGAWEHAVGPAAAPVWTTNVLTTGGAWFWRAEGADGTNMVLKTEE